MENIPNGNFSNFNFAAEEARQENPQVASVQNEQHSQNPSYGNPQPMQGNGVNTPNAAYGGNPNMNGVPFMGNAPSYTVPNNPQNSYGYNPAGYSQPMYGGQYNPQYNQSQQSPVSIYNNAQRGNAPQYHYGYGTPTPFINHAYYQEQQAKMIKRRNSEKVMSKVGNISGFVLLGSFGVSFLFSVIYAIPSLTQLIESNLSVSSLYNMFYSIFGIGLAFFLFSKLYSGLKKPAYPGAALENKARSDFKTSFAFPKDGYKTLLLMVIAFGGCMIANYVSSIILTLFETIGVYSTYSSVENPKTLSDTIMMFLSVAVIPPLIEELALRGIVLSNLRKYGNAFAIIASAFMFGIFHGTAAQILFAFLCGLFFGYITIATESIWPAIIVHAVNNSLSCITSVLLQVADDATANNFYYIFSIGGTLLAAFGVLLYIKSYGKNKILDFNGEEDCLTTGQKMKKFLLSPVMIAVIVLYTLMALMTLTTNISNIG